MANLKVPSLQHLARNWREAPVVVKRTLVQLVKNPPNFSYAPLFGAVHDMLVFGQPYNEIVAGIERIKRSDVRENLLGVLPLIRDYFDEVSPTFVQSIDRRYYPVGRGLLVPFDPPLIYGVNGELHFPWFSFWRSYPLAGDRLSLFVTIVEEVLLQDPDLENAKFTILDFSAARPKEERTLKIIDSADVPRLSAERKAGMLEIFAEGYFMAQAELAADPPRDRDRDERDDKSDDQPDLFP